MIDMTLNDLIWGMSISSAANARYSWVVNNTVYYTQLPALLTS